MNPGSEWRVVDVKFWVVGSAVECIVKVATATFAEDIGVVSWRDNGDGPSCPTEKITEVVGLLLFFGVQLVRC